MNYISPNIVECQFFVKLFCPLFALNKDQYWWIERLQFNKKLISNKQLTRTNIKKGKLSHFAQNDYYKWSGPCLPIYSSVCIISAYRTVVGRFSISNTTNAALIFYTSNCNLYVKFYVNTIPYSSHPFQFPII